MYLEINIDYTPYYGKGNYELNVCLPFELLEFLVEEQITKNLITEWELPKTIGLGEIEGKHSDINCNIIYNIVENKSYIVTEEMEDILEDLLWEIFDYMQIKDEAEVFDEKFKKEFENMYGFVKEDLVKSIKYLLKKGN